MKIAIVHDSIFGNTAKIAEAIADALRPGNEVALLPVGEAKSLALAGLDLLVVGSPTRGFRPTPAISEYTEGLDSAQLAGTRTAAFDTRIAAEDIHPAPLRWVVEAGGYAADRIAASFANKGCVSAGTPGGFVVTGTEGPLREGEIARARDWALGLARVA
ncbi:MAG: flavodoxin domain-containing protein [Devosia sp.]